MACKLHYASYVRKISPHLLGGNIVAPSTEWRIMLYKMAYNDNIRRANLLDNRSYVA